MLGVPGVASGEWIVAYNGPAGQTGNWQSQITAGEIVLFKTSSGSGHITTVVSGSGSSAMVVDNIAFENGNGQITNSANDGAWDIIIGQPHSASYEWGLAVAGSVVVYQLDCPIIKIVTPSSRVAAGGTEQLAPLFLATNPLAGQAITEYQFYDSGTGGAANDSFSVNGSNVFANSAANAFNVSASDLANLSLQAGPTRPASTPSRCAPSTAPIGATGGNSPSILLPKVRSSARIRQRRVGRRDNRSTLRWRRIPSPIRRARR